MSATNSATSWTSSNTASTSSSAGTGRTDCSEEEVEFPTIEELKRCTSDDEIIGNKYDNFEPIGEGGFGVVYRVKHKFDKKNYALKVIPLKSEHSEEEEGEFASEINILAALDNVNVVKYHTSCKLSRCECDDLFERKYVYFCIQMEYCSKTLKDFIDGFQFVSTSETKKQRHKNLCQIVDGLKYIHDNGVMHRDLNPRNIFLTKDGIIKIGDFGSSRQTAILISDAGGSDHLASNKSLTKRIGTLKYCAPELKTGKYDKRLDLYSLGIIIFEMYFLPGATEQEKEPAFRDIRSERVIVPDSFPPEMKDIVEGLLQHNPDNRMTLNQASEAIKGSNAAIENGGTQEKINELGNVTNRLRNPVSFDLGCGSQDYRTIEHVIDRMSSAHGMGPYGDNGNNEGNGERYRNQIRDNDDDDDDSDEKSKITREAIRVITGKPPKDKAHIRKVKSMIETSHRHEANNQSDVPFTVPVSQREMDDMSDYFRNRKKVQPVKSNNDESVDTEKCSEEQQTEVSDHTTDHLPFDTRLQQLDLAAQVSPSTNQTEQQSITTHQIDNEPGTANIHLQSVSQGAGSVEPTMPVFSTVQKPTQSTLSDTLQQN